MQKYFFTLAIVFFACTSIAQRTVPDFGKITAEDLRLASCPFEPDAAAMKLFDIEETELIFLPVTLAIALKSCDALKGFGT